VCTFIVEKGVKRQRSFMGKERETFEAWWKPGRGGKVTTPVQESHEDSRRGKSKCSTEKDNIKIPRGMKRTPVQRGT